MARPEKSEAEKLQKTVAFRITKADYDKYRETFGASGLSQSEFFRLHVLNNTTKVVARPIASSDAKRAVFFLQKASNNINQLAYRANSDHLSGKLSESGFSAIIDQLQQLNSFMLEQANEAAK